ncbi:hypothetical protein UFOVP99_15 [uncultured Caudovirales phage]|uniref:Uncharacterized protein n=1 Tax=uncultured Caudovirales phage TaxID=2100421 RepID=A0A6J5L6A6_9CAUD|nr:hypothetical protein UFOVP99_15 [uncultured Caudovirales phage]
MGVSPECVAAVVDASGQKFTDGEAAELIRYMEAMRAAELAKGNLDNMDARVQQLAREQAEQAQIAAAVAKRHAALAVVAYDRSMRQVRELHGAGLRRSDAVLAMLEGSNHAGPNTRFSIQATSAAYLSRYLTPFKRLLLDPEVGRLVESGDRQFADNVVREMDQLGAGGKPGITQDDKALVVARAYADMAELSRTDRNRHGATLGKLEGWRPQAHDSNLVALADRDAWIDFILPRLDAERTFPGMNEAQQRAILRDTYHHIATGDRGSPSGMEQTGRVGPANLANQLSASRELHFRTSDAWLEYRERFGGQHIHGAMVAHLQRAAKQAAMLEMLGPNPESTLNRVRATLAREAAEDASLKPQQLTDERKALTGTTGALSQAWAEASGLTRQPANTRLAEIMSGARNWQRAAKLAGALLSQVSDLAIRASRLTLQGAPVLESYGRSIGLLVNPGQTPEVRQLLASVAAGADGMRNSAWAELMPEDARPGVLSKIVDTTFRIQGQAWWSDRLRSGTALMMAQHMGEQAQHAWPALDPLYRRRLESYGITPTTWEAMRQHAAQADGRNLLTPDAAQQLPRQVLAAIAKPKLEAMQRGMTDRVARRSAADATEAGWVAKRVARFDAELARAQASWAAWSEQAQGSAGRQKDKLRGQIDEVRLRLTELAEFRDAVAEGRTWQEAAPGAAPTREEWAAKGYEIGPHGPIFADVQGEAAVRRLLEARDGEAPAAFQHPDIGPIDLVYGQSPAAGQEGHGLSKISVKHPEMLAGLTTRLADMKVTSRTENRIRLADDDGRAVVRLEYDGKRKTWLLTAYEPGRNALRATEDGQAARGGQADTAPLTQGTKQLGAGGGKSNAFVPRGEAYLHAVEPPEAAALRGEGEMKARLDRLRRAIGRVGQEATRADVRRMDAFDAAWTGKRQELDQFIAQVESRSRARMADTGAEAAAWESRVDLALADARRDTELAFRRFFADEMLGATLEPDAQLRRFLYRGTQPGEGKGELLRMVGLFKAFPVAYGQRVLSTAFHGFQAGERGRQAGHIGALLAGSLVAGYVSMTAKDLVRGNWPPRDPTDAKTWVAAMAQGGGLGIYGDFLFGQVNRFGNGPLETVAGPLLSGAAGLVTLWQKVRSGDAKAGEALNLVLRETPFLNLWYARPILDALLLRGVRDLLAPGSVQRADRRRETDFGQRRWLPTVRFD